MRELSDLKWVGDFVLRERGILNMGRNELARKANVPYKYIYNLETGAITQPRFEESVKILKALGVKFYYSFDDE